MDDKRPELVAVETQILHSEKKAKNAASLHERVEKDHSRQAGSLATLKAGAAELKKQMDKAKREYLIAADLTVRKAIGEKPSCGQGTV